MKIITQFKDKHDFLSNFSYLPILLEWKGELWSMVEHAFQAEKCLDSQAQKEIRNAETPGMAKKLGGTVKLRDDWEQIKIPTMTELVWLKFEQNPFLSDKLVDTKYAYIVEGNYRHDNFWGDCYCSRCSQRKGKNILGIILMNIRKEI